MYREELRVRLLTPGFCGGADQNQPEIRAASIRGHIRRWHTVLFNEIDMKQVWGSMGGGASKIQLRVEVLTSSNRSDVLLPHKTQGAGMRSSLKSEFSVHLASRDRAALTRAYKSLELWSLLGALGTRANRAAGSVWPDEAPYDLATLETQILSFGCRLDIRVSQEVGPVEALRKSASDTLAIPYLFGSANPRKESPVKLKVIELSDGFHLLAWAAQNGVIDSAVMELKKRNKPLGTYQWVKIP